MQNLQKNPLFGKEIYFTPDLDRGATFRIVEELPTERLGVVKVTLHWLEGRWSPPGSDMFVLEVPTHYTQSDIEAAWWEIKSFEDFTKS